MLGLTLASLDDPLEVPRWGEVDLGPGEAAGGRPAYQEPAVDEHVKHPGVVGHHVREEGRDALLARLLSQVLQQERPETDGVVLVIDEERDLRNRGVGLRSEEAAHSDDGAVNLGEQRAPVGRRPDDPVDVPVAAGLLGAEVAQQPGPRGQPGVQLPQQTVVVGERPAQLGDPAVPQQDVNLPRTLLCRSHRDVHPLSSPMLRNARCGRAPWAGPLVPGRV